MVSARERESQWSSSAGPSWTDRVTGSLVAQYGRWACGWRWARDEGEIGGGPITSWCCPSHSIASPDVTAARVGDALVEWREWLEELGTRFAGCALPASPGTTQHDAWERAVPNL